MASFVSGVILAAGQSSRLGRPKQLLALAGEPLLSHVLRHAAASNLDEIVLVLGHEAATIAAHVGEWDQRVVINPDYAAGQSTSLRAGLAAIEPTASAVLFLLGDQPQVTSDMISALVDAFRERGGPIVRAAYGGQPGNPVLFSRELFPELAHIGGDQGAREVIQQHASEVLLVDVSPVPPPADVDTEEDYQALLRRWNASAGRETGPR